MSCQPSHENMLLILEKLLAQAIFMRYGMMVQYYFKYCYTDILQATFFKRILLNKNAWILIMIMISLRYVPQHLIDNKSALVWATNLQQAIIWANDGLAY